MLALPMRGFMFVMRPLLRALNSAANWCLHRVGVTPVDELTETQNPDALRQLVEHSATVGTLAPAIMKRAGIDRDTAFGAVTPPLVLSSNFSFAGFAEKRQYDYTRSGNPTRDLLGEGEFVEVHVDTPLAVAEARDVKGLYARVRRGELTQFTGVSDDYEMPTTPDLRIDTDDDPTGDPPRYL